MQLEARLRAFAALSRMGSFSAAAQELVISQPAVSKHVAELEAELGTLLVIRGARRIRLTPAGEFVADYVVRAEALVAQAARGARALAGAETGRLAIATSGSGMYLAIEPIAAFHAAHVHRFRAELERVPQSLAYAFAVVTFDQDAEWRAMAEPLLAARLEQDRQRAIHDPREILRGP